MLILMSILKAVVAWVAMQYIGINLLGYVVRGLLAEGVPRVSQISNYPEASTRVKVVIGVEIFKQHLGNFFLTLLFVVVSVAYFWAVYHYLGGVLAVAAGALMMLDRLPPLLREIRTGKKITAETANSTPLDFILMALNILTLPLLWFAIWRSS